MTDQIIEQMIRDMRVVPPTTTRGTWYWYIPAFACIAIGLAMLVISFIQQENLPPPTLTRGDLRVTAVILFAISYLVYYVQRQRLTLQQFNNELSEEELIEFVKEYADKNDWLLLDNYKSYYYYCKGRIIRESPDISIIVRENKLYANVLYDNKLIDDFVLNLRYKEHKKKKEIA